MPTASDTDIDGDVDVSTKNAGDAVTVTRQPSGQVSSTVTPTWPPVGMTAMAATVTELVYPSPMLTTAGATAGTSTFTAWSSAQGVAVVFTDFDVEGMA